MVLSDATDLAEVAEPVPELTDTGGDDPVFLGFFSIVPAIYWMGLAFSVKADTVQYLHWKQPEAA